MVLPLDDALVAGHSLGQPQLNPNVTLQRVFHVVFGSRAISHLQHVLVEALLGGGGVDVVVGAQLPVHPAEVVGGHVDIDVDDLSFFVVTDDGAGGEFAAGLVSAWTLVAITANAALVIVHDLVLGKEQNSIMISLTDQLDPHSESSAVEFVVIVVSWGIEAEPPRGASGGRVHETTMAHHASQDGQQTKRGYEETIHDGVFMCSKSSRRGGMSPHHFILAFHSIDECCKTFPRKIVQPAAHFS